VNVRRHSPTMIHRPSVSFIKPPPLRPQSHTATVANTRDAYLSSSYTHRPLYLSLVRSVRRDGIRIRIYGGAIIYIYIYG